MGYVILAQMCWWGMDGELIKGNLILIPIDLLSCPNYVLDTKFLTSVLRVGYDRGLLPWFLHSSFKKKNVNVGINICTFI